MMTCDGLTPSFSIAAKNVNLTESSVVGVPIFKRSESITQKEDKIELRVLEFMCRGIWVHS